MMLSNHFLSSTEQVHVGLPVEMYQLILMKSAILLYKTLPSEQVYNTLTSVCCQWYDIITRWKWFRNKLRQYLTRYPPLTLQMPWELWEILLVKSVVKFYLTVGHEVAQPASPSFTAICSVCFIWNMTVVTRRWFRRTVRKIIKNVYSPYLRCPRELVTIDIEKTGVQGVAQLIDKIFIVHSNSDKVLVFGKDKPHIQMKDLILKDLKSARDIVGCAETQQLYVADYGNCVVWRVKMDGTAIDKWLPRPTDNGSSVDSDMVMDVDTAKNCNTKNSNTTDVETADGPRAMSVRSVGRVLVVTRNQLTVYGPDGSILRQVDIPEYMDVRHAVETCKDSFIVCCTGHCGDFEHDQVIEMDVNGRVLQAYGSKRGNILNEPCHVAIDTTQTTNNNNNSTTTEPTTTSTATVVGFNRAFVADFGNRRVLMLNNKLQLERVLLSNIDAFRLCYIQERGQLLVGTQTSGVILYQLTNLE